MGCTVIGTGKALPALEVKNDELAAIVDTNDEWITTRTGIKSRHISVGETNGELAERAARAALGWSDEGWSERRIGADEIDLVIVSTITADNVVPSAACDLRRHLGLPNAVAFDVNAACTGFIYGIDVAESMMVSSNLRPGARNPIRRALVVGAEQLSRITNWADRSTCVLFGDGAGAAVLEWNDDRAGVLASFLANADDDSALVCPAVFDSPVPFDENGVTSLEAGSPARTVQPGEDGAIPFPIEAIAMNGGEVFKFASNAMAHALTETLARAGRSIDEVKVVVPHQANERIVKYAAKKLGVPMDRFFMNIDHTGNSSAASVPMALADAYAAGRIERGDLVALVGFGGGYTSGAVLYEA